MGESVSGAQEVQWMRVDELRRNPQNARDHPAEQVLEVAASITQFGFNDPLQLSADGELVAGHCRLEAAESLGLELVPVILHAHLDAAAGRAYGLAHNKTYEGGVWNEELLAAELQAAGEAGHDMAGLGWTDGELEELEKLMEKEMGAAADAAGGHAHQGGRGLGTPVLAYNLIFEDTDQQARWFNLLRALKVAYPTAETIAGRMDLLVRERLTDLVEPEGT